MGEGHCLGQSGCAGGAQNHGDLVATSGQGSGSIKG